MRKIEIWTLCYFYITKLTLALQKFDKILTTLWFILHKTSNTDLYINWDGFRDVEEYDTGPHATGIKEYILGIGKYWYMS